MRVTHRHLGKGDGPLWPSPPTPAERLAATHPARAPAIVAEAPGSRTVGARALERWQLREALRPVQPWPRLRTCGITPIGPVQLGPGWIAGLAQCGSVHACPCCSASRRGARATEIRSLVAMWSKTDPAAGAGLLTLTIRHRWGAASLAELRKGLAGAWRRLWKGSGSDPLRSAVAHMARALDVTHGPHEWHPHLHVLVLYRRPPPDGWREELAVRWHAAVVAELGPGAAPRIDPVGVRWDPKVRADYLVKLGLEVAGSTGGKSARVTGPESADVWEIARRAASELRRGRRTSEQAPWIERWQRWAIETRGARALTWSRGAHRLAEDAVETPEPPDVDASPWAVVVAPSDWARTVGGPIGRGRLPDLLATTTEGPTATLDALEHLGCRAHRIAVTTAATVVSTSGGIFDATNTLARRNVTLYEQSAEREAVRRDIDSNADTG